MILRGFFVGLTFVLAVLAVRVIGDHIPRAIARAEVATSTEWSLPGHDYSGNRYIADSGGITKQNVAGLQLAWRYRFATPSVIEAAPIVVDGTVYVSSGGDTVAALDARTGAERWHYTYPISHAVGLGVNRGVAVAGARVYLGTLDDHLVAPGERDGHLLWNVAVGDDPAHSYTAIAPLPYGDRILVAPSAGMWGGSGSAFTLP